jgi:hypothetical protein
MGWKMSNGEGPQLVRKECFVHRISPVKNAPLRLTPRPWPRTVATAPKRTVEFEV